jgi:hypothetical protein
METANGPQPPAPASASCAADNRQRRLREALRIQVAAVAAQQAALTEAEMRIEERRTALEQQERQLAAHLEEKRQRLVTLRDEAHAAQDFLGKARQAYERRVAEVMQRMGAERQALTADRRQTDTERRRLLGLHQRLKQRYHRHWATERAASNRREAALLEQAAELGRQKEQLRKEQASLAEARLRFNGEVEVSRRQLQEERDTVLRERAALQMQIKGLAQREAAVTAAERELAAERQQWAAARQLRQTEAEGLERRIGNYRQKIQEQERDVARLDATGRSFQGVRFDSGRQAKEQESHSTVCGMVPPQAAAKAPVAAETHSDHPAASLEQLAGVLADQRLYLAEQMERLAQAEQRWQRDRDAAAVELEALGATLQQREASLQACEAALVPERERLERQAEMLAQGRRELQVREALAAAAAARWEGGRDRLLTALRCREAFLDQRLIEVSQLRQLWDARRRRQVLGVRQRRKVCEELRREWAALRADCLAQAMAVIQERRTLAERALALEQFRQALLGRTHDPTAADKRIKQLRGRWAMRFAAAKETLTREQRRLEAEGARVDSLAQELHEQANALDTRESELARREGSREGERLVKETVQDHLRQELSYLQRQRGHYEREISQLREEVDRLARLLLDESAEPAVPLGRAA